MSSMRSPAHRALETSTGYHPSTQPARLLSTWSCKHMRWNHPQSRRAFLQRSPLTQLCHFIVACPIAMQTRRGCRKCASVSISGAGALRCSCTKGTYLNSTGMSEELSRSGHGCKACPEKTFKSSVGDGPCIPARVGYQVDPDRTQEVIDASWDATVARTKNFSFFGLAPYFLQPAIKVRSSGVRIGEAVCGLWWLWLRVSGSQCRSGDGRFRAAALPCAGFHILPNSELVFFRCTLSALD